MNLPHLSAVQARGFIQFLTEMGSRDRNRAWSVKEADSDNGVDSVGSLASHNHTRLLGLL
jgi:hypothetical protein